MKIRSVATLVIISLAFTTSATAAEKTYTAAVVKKHSTQKSCWTIVGKNVYDLTKFIQKHPGGAGFILSICGKNGTAMFNGQHRGEGRPTMEISRYKIGRLA